MIWNMKESDSRGPDLPHESQACNENMKLMSNNNEILQNKYEHNAISQLNVNTCANRSSQHVGFLNSSSQKQILLWML